MNVPILLVGTGAQNEMENFPKRTQAAHAACAVWPWGGTRVTLQSVCLLDREIKTETKRSAVPPSGLLILLVGALDFFRLGDKRVFEPVFPTFLQLKGRDVKSLFWGGDWDQKGRVELSELLSHLSLILRLYSQSFFKSQRTKPVQNRFNKTRHFLKRLIDIKTRQT